MDTVRLSQLLMLGTGSGLTIQDPPGSLTDIETIGQYLSDLVTDLRRQLASTEVAKPTYRESVPTNVSGKPEQLRFRGGLTWPVPQYFGALKEGEVDFDAEAQAILRDQVFG